MDSREKIMKEELAKQHAIECHEKINHLYGDKPYSFHLEAVREVGERYERYIPEDDRDDVFAAIWEHDTLEDCDCTFSKLGSLFGIRVALIVNAVTTKKGSREERFNIPYYRKIRNTKYATFVKLCDRISNVEQCISNNKELLWMYQREHNLFKEMLDICDTYKDMWEYLDSLFISS